MKLYFRYQSWGQVAQAQVEWDLDISLPASLELLFQPTQRQTGGIFSVPYCRHMSSFSFHAASLQPPASSKSPCTTTSIPSHIFQLAPRGLFPRESTNHALITPDYEYAPESPLSMCRVASGQDILLSTSTTPLMRNGIRELSTAVEQIPCGVFPRLPQYL